MPAMTSPLRHACGPQLANPGWKPPQRRKIPVALAPLGFALMALGCSDDASSVDGSTGHATQGTTSTDPQTSSTSDDGTAGSETTANQVFDVGMQPPDMPPERLEECSVGALNAARFCEPDRKVADSFETEIEWSHTFSGYFGASIPLVANLTDDNGDGVIDLCDTPDVLAVSSPNGLGIFDGEGLLHVVDGASGTPHFEVPITVAWPVTPAIGDIDDDGLPEIVTATFKDKTVAGPGTLVAFEHDGTHKWTGYSEWGVHPYGIHGSAIALADLDNDGKPEILAGEMVADHRGKTLWRASEGLAPYDLDNDGFLMAAPTAADLDGDGDLEVVFGSFAYHHDGSVHYNNVDVRPGFAQVADIDGDQLPEVVVTNDLGVTALDHQGSILWQDVGPTTTPGAILEWTRPLAIDEIDGNPGVELVVSSPSAVTIHDPSGAALWSAPIQDTSNGIGASAFRFLPTGPMTTLIADELSLFALDHIGTILTSAPRPSVTIHTYPVVADVDNDGSAELLVGDESNHIVQVYGPKTGDWQGARRIWNQHTYHVTNVREDSTIPQFEQPHWLGLNSFRTQAVLPCANHID